VYIIVLVGGMAMEFKDLLKKRRLELGMTLQDIADKCSVSKATVQRWETGEIKNVRRDKIVSLSNALKVTPAYLMGWEDNKENFSKVFASNNEEYTPNMQIRTLQEIKNWFGNNIYTVVDIMKDFSEKEQEELLKRANELRYLKNMKK